MKPMGGYAPIDLCVKTVIAEKKSFRLIRTGRSGAISKFLNRKIVD
jgi:hypothetical protein